MDPSIADSMAGQHQEIDARLIAAARHLDDGDLTAAAAALEDLGVGLRRHIELEEDHLFPAFDALPGADAALGAAMRAQHRELERMVAAMTAAAERGDRGAAFQAKAVLHAELGVHDDDEAAICAALDGGLDRAAHAELVARMSR